MSRRRFVTSRPDASPIDPFGAGGLSSAASSAGLPGSPGRAHDRIGRRGVLREVTRAISRRRRLVAAGLAAAGVALALHLLAPEPPRTVAVLAAARDLSGGAPLTPADVREVALPPQVVPAGVLLPGDPRSGGPGRRGAVVAGPVRAGEPLTDVRLLGPDLLARVRSSTQVVAAPVRVADPGSLALVRPGDRIDLLAADTGVDQAAARPARVVATHVRVLALPGSTGEGANGSGGDAGEPLGGLGSGGSVETGGEGGLVVVAVPAETAADLARAAVTSRISLVLRAVP